jgi:hypothetical protein
MNAHARKYLDRATRYARLAEVANDKDMQVFLVTLACALARASAQARASDAWASFAPASRMQH